LTKGVFPEELGQRNSFSINNEYGITLVSLDEDFRKEYEPNASDFKDRISSLKYLHRKGFKTWVSMEPYPTPNFIEQDLICLLYTSDAADDLLCVDLGGRRIIKKKKTTL